MHTHKKRKRAKNNISCSQSPPPQFGMIRCLFRYSTDAGTSSWLWRFNPLLPRLLGEISLSILCSHSSQGSGLDLAPPLRVGRLRASVLRCSSLFFRQDGVKGAAASGALAHPGRGEGGVQRRRGEPAAAEASWRCSSLRRAVHSPGEVVPGSRDPGSGGLHRLPGGSVWRVTCARTQASWWRQ